MTATQQAKVRAVPRNGSPRKGPKTDTDAAMFQARSVSSIAQSAETLIGAVVVLALAVFTLAAAVAWRGCA